MIIPEQIVHQLLQEAWSEVYLPDKQVKIISIKSSNLNLSVVNDYYEIKYVILDDPSFLASVSYSYSLHIKPRIIASREKRLNELLNLEN
jgi:hypothetical protein